MTRTKPETQEFQESEPWSQMLEIKELKAVQGQSQIAESDRSIL